MKKLGLVMFFWMSFMASYGQVRVNVHLYDNNQRLYFRNTHQWMEDHGYRYHNDGYYIRHNQRIYPTRKEYYHRENKHWDNHVNYRHDKNEHHDNGNHKQNGRSNDQRSHHGKKGKK